MSTRPTLSSVLAAFGPDIDHASTAGGALYASLDNAKYQELAENILFPHLMKNLMNIDPSGTKMESLLFDEEGDLVPLYFLKSWMVSSQHFADFTTYSLTIDFARADGDQSQDILMDDEGREFYAATEVFTAQCDLFLDRVSGKDYLSVQNLVLARAPEERPQLDDGPDFSDVTPEAYYIPVGSMMGFVHLKKMAPPILKKALGQVNGGKQLRVDPETMLLVNDDNPNQKALSAVLYLAAYMNPRFPDYRLMDVFADDEEDLMTVPELFQNLLNGDVPWTQVAEEAEAFDVTDEDIQAVDQFLKDIEEDDPEKNP
jgi:hypothetical protein